MPTEINMFAILSSSDLFTREDTLCFFTRRGDGSGGRKHFAHIFGKFIVIHGLCHKVTCSEAQRFRNETVGCKPRYHYRFRFFVKSGKRAQHAESVQFGHNDIEK